MAGRWYCARRFEASMHCCLMGVVHGLEQSTVARYAPKAQGQRLPAPRAGALAGPSVSLVLGAEVAGIKAPKEPLLHHPAGRRWPTC